MRNLILGIALCSSFISLGFAGVLTADEYKVYLEEGQIDTYRYGQLVASQNLPTGLIVVYKRQRNGNYLVKDFTFNQSFVVNEDCIIVKGTKLHKRGYTTCPIDPRRPVINVWLPLDKEGNTGVSMALYRSYDDEDLNGDGEYDDILYKGYATYDGWDISYYAIYDGKTGKAEYEETHMINSQYDVESHGYATYRVDIKQAYKPQPTPQPQPPQPKPPVSEKIPTLRDIIGAFLTF